MSNSNLSGKVANPKLTLYAFHLRNNLARGYDQPVDDANYLWEQCQEIGQKLNIPRLQSLIERLQDSNGTIGLSPNQDNSQSNYLELLKQERTLSFSAIPNGSNLQLRGEIYPLQIHDTYGVDITLRYPYPNVEIEQLGGLNHQGCLLLSPSKSSLAQTLVLFAQPVGDIKDVEAFANACLTVILPESERKNFPMIPTAKGKLLGSPIFEYDNCHDNMSQRKHILIWLNCHPQTETLEASEGYYQPLIHLLCYRSKILYTYSESRWCDRHARSLYQELETKVKDFTQLPSEPLKKLNYLKVSLTQIPQNAFEYTRYLRDLELHHHTIETNSKNYDLWLKKLQAVTIQGEDNLELWTKFITHTQEKFTEQIRVDLGYLSPAQPLFQQMIEASRGIVGTEQAESDRALQKTVAIVGFSLGGAGIGATLAPYVIPTEPRQPILPPFLTNHLHPFTQSLLLSLGLGFTFAVITQRVMTVMQNRHLRKRI